MQSKQRIADSGRGATLIQIRQRHQLGCIGITKETVFKITRDRSKAKDESLQCSK